MRAEATKSRISKTGKWINITHTYYGFWILAIVFSPAVIYCRTFSEQPPLSLEYYNQLNNHVVPTSAPILTPKKVRFRRQLSTPIFAEEYRSCLFQSGCSTISNMTSTASGGGNMFFISTPTQILKVDLGSGENPLCVCKVVFQTEIPILSIVMDDSYVYWLNEEHTKIMYMTINSDKPLPKSKLLRPEMLAEDKEFHHAACRIPSYISTLPSPYKVTESFALFNLSLIMNKEINWFNSTVCVHESNPNISFAFLYRKEHETLPKSCFQMFDCFYRRVGNASLDKVLLSNLSPSTDYFIHLIIYSESSVHKSAIISPAISFRTSCSIPPPLADLKCNGLNNTALMVSWQVPITNRKSKFIFEVFVNNDTEPIGKISHDNEAKMDFIHADIKYASKNYTIKVSSSDCEADDQRYSISNVFNCTPFQPPMQLLLEHTTSRHATVLWKKPEDNGVRFVKVEWMNLERKRGVWSQSLPILGNSTFSYTVTDLEPNTGYSFRTIQQYTGYENEGWLKSQSVNGKTMPSEPDFPSNVRVVREGDIDFLSWGVPNDNGSPLEYYIIQYRNRSSPNATRLLFGQWVSLLQVTARSTIWEIFDSNLIPFTWYEFRVCAVNMAGTGDASQPSQPFQYNPPQSFQDDFVLWIVICATGGLVVVIFIIILIVACRRCGQVSTTYHTPPSSDITTIHLSYGADLQLEQLRHLTEVANFKGVLSGVPPDYMDLLPLFPRDKLTLTDFLGKGAFGEVFRGIAVEQDGDMSIERKVAVKTLQEGSTDGEKCEFLMEAYFMSTFKHKNILSLIGVCLDNEPQYLILELMEGGDLLHYLRDARSDSIMGPKLTLPELLDISLDVAAGCKYLEEQRFIHRDLAARNCLVSTKIYHTEERVVKIGDFGLARDIYKNDYYQKAGEGLLPVRWMAPESLVDNLYTTQSDVWAFGILLWEIMTFGEQPYPARTNIEVLQHVRSGGRLGRPENCPKDFYSLMIKCWHDTPSLRLSFSWALKWLQQIKDRSVTANSGDDNEIFLSNIEYGLEVTSSEGSMGVNDMNVASADPRETIPNFSEMEGHYNEAFEPLDSLDQLDVMLGGELDSDNEVANVSLDDIPAYSFMPSPQESMTNSYLVMSRESNDVNDLPSLAFRENYITFQPSDESSDDDVITRPTTNFTTDIDDDMPIYSSFSISVEPRPTTSSLFSESNYTMRNDDCLLPYIGELPITDEERLMRKKQWNRKRRLRREEEIAYTSSADFQIHETSQRGINSEYAMHLNLDYNIRGSSPPATNNDLADYQSGITIPMKTFTSSQHTSEQDDNYATFPQNCLSFNHLPSTSVDDQSDHNEQYPDAENDNENIEVNVPTYV